MKNRFGMFIHWGIYALYADHEQVLARRNLDNAAYERRMAEFNPVRYDPEEWVKLAKDAGMRYICFTAKHHDGFCMWDTRETAYNIMNTPYGRDVLKLLSDACRKHGMALSLYYSNPDWHEPSAYNPLSTHQWKSIDPSKGDSEKYRAFVKAQLTELLTNYGPIYTLFWDIPPRYEDPSLNALARRLQPGILINDRGYDAGDFSTPERSVPEGSRFERMTEACDSVGEQSWGLSRKRGLPHAALSDERHRQDHGHGRKLSAERRPHGGRPHPGRSRAHRPPRRRLVYTHERRAGGYPARPVRLPDSREPRHRADEGWKDVPSFL